MIVFVVGWLFYQLLIKKKRWADVSSDAMAIVFFVLVWILIAYWAFS
jgi:hypothetical protein